MFVVVDMNRPSNTLSRKADYRRRNQSAPSRSHQKKATYQSSARIHTLPRYLSSKVRHTQPQSAQAAVSIVA